MQANARVIIVPFDISLSLGDKFYKRYKNFIKLAQAAEIPIWSLEAAFANLPFSQLKVNNQDSHPNEFANRIAAEEIAKQLLSEFHSKACTLLTRGSGKPADDRAYQ